MATVSDAVQAIGTRSLVPVAENSMALVPYVYEPEIIPPEEVFPRVKVLPDRDPFAGGSLAMMFNRMVNQMVSVELNIVQATEAATKSQERYNKEVNKGKQIMNNLLKSVKKIAMANLSRGAKALIQMSDEYVNTRTRLDFINDGLQSTGELQSKIFAAAGRARVSYSNMAGIIGQMGTQAAHAFSGNDEMIAFAELMQKSFRIAGASDAEQQAGMKQILQAMSTGKLKGDEIANAPVLAKAISDFTGWSMEEVTKKSAEGAITADIIKGAIFAAADEINAKFEEMPMTFGQIMTMLQSNALKAFEPVLLKINEFANNEKLETFIANLTTGISAIATVALGLVDVLMGIANIIIENWSIIEPIIWGIVAALGTYLLITQVVTAATQLAAAAQWFWNNVIKAHPIMFIISSIIALVMFLIRLWQTNDQFAAALMGAWHSILNFFDRIPIFFAKVKYGIVNILHDMRVKALETMEKLINGIVDKINKLIERLNKIPGVSIEALEHIDISSKAALEAEAFRQAGEEAIRAMEENYAQKVAEREKDKQDWLESRAARRAQEEAERAAEVGYGYHYDYTEPPVDNIKRVDEVGKINDTVDISSEDLVLMRELAEMKSIQNFVSLTPTVQVTTGDLHQEADIDVLVSKIERKLEDEFHAAAEGVYN